MKWLIVWSALLLQLGIHKWGARQGMGHHEIADGFRFTRNNLAKSLVQDLIAKFPCDHTQGDGCRFPPEPDLYDVLRSMLKVDVAPISESVGDPKQCGDGVNAKVNLGEEAAVIGFKKIRIHILFLGGFAPCGKTY